MRRFAKLFAVLMFGFAALAIPTIAFSSDPVPINPTLTPTATPGGSTAAALPADYNYWWTVVIPGLLALDPDATYAELCDAAYTLFNILPPVTSPTASATSSDPQPIPPTAPVGP